MINFSVTKINTFATMSFQSKLWRISKCVHYQLSSNQRFFYNQSAITVKDFINPSKIWSSNDNITPPSTIALPSRYVQGNNISKYIGNYLQLLPSKKCGVLADKTCQNIVYDTVNTSLLSNDIEPIWLEHNGECSYIEAMRLSEICRNEKNIDSVMAFGGGKSIDTGKLVSHYLDTKFISCPTIASTDAPASSHTVVYSENGQFVNCHYLQRNPDLVVVDTNIIANAPVRFFKAGIGDALATYYEAKACYDNPNAKNFDGGRIALSIVSWTKLCSEILFDYGVEAIKSVENKIVTDALDKCVEATILLSGVGFQSGGIASAHSVAMALTNIEYIHDNYMHGEHVAVGLVCQLLLEKNYDEAVKVMKFLTDVGLPINLNQLNIEMDNDENKQKLDVMAEEATNLWTQAHSFNITKEMILDCLREANEMQNLI
eukprot:555548_1